MIVTFETTFLLRNFLFLFALGTEKVGLLNGDIMNVHPEYDDAASIASTNGVPLKDVMHEATKNANLMLMEQYSEQDV